MSRFDSDAVASLKAKLLELGSDGSDWAKTRRRRLQGQIRSQRLLEARARGSHTDEEWQAIVARFDARCVRCGCVPVGGPCKDHIVPIYQGGSDAADNLQPLCRHCNGSKGPETTNWAAYRDENGFLDIDLPEERF